jgi:two-component system, cell cycle sensor histidine kinase and response regulator CckA
VSDAPLVLLVEDQPRVRRMVRSMLERRGYRVLEAADGHEALAQLSRDRDGIDLVVSDVVMPEITGPELAARMRVLGYTTPVLLMSGHADRTLIERGLIDETTRVLHKPFTLAQLSARVEELLGGHDDR